MKYNIQNIKIDEKEIQNVISGYFKNKLFEESNYKIKHISTGSYGKIYEYSINNKNFIVKKPSGEEKDDIKACYAESMISSILSAFQSKYLKKTDYNKKIVPKIYGIIEKPHSEIKIIAMQKFNEDTFRIFERINVKNDSEKDLLIEMINQIAYHLDILQKHFKFMHNDMKTNNILYKLKNESEPLSKDNVNFIITDFGGSTLEFDNNIIKGEVKGNEIYFNKAKDMYLLIHLLITFNKNSFKNYMIDFFKEIFTNLNLDNCVVKDNKWHNLYEEKNYPQEYEPLNIINKLESIYLNKENKYNICY